MLRIIKNNKGMSLVELVVAVVFLMIVVTGFSVFFTQSILQTAKSGGDTKNYMTAKRFADNVLAGIQDDASALSAFNSGAYNTEYVDGGVETVYIEYKGMPSGGTDDAQRHLWYVKVNNTPEDTGNANTNLRKITYKVYLKD